MQQMYNNTLALINSTTFNNVPVIGMVSFVVDEKKILDGVGETWQNTLTNLIH